MTELSTTSQYFSFGVWLLIYGVMHWPAPSRASAAPPSRPDEQQLAADAFYTAVAFQADMRQTDTDRYIKPYRHACD